jgi:hypothetical protein
MATGTEILDFGATPAYEAEVTVTTSGLTASTRLEAFVQKETTAGGPDVANGVDEHEMLAFFGRFVCEYVSATQFKIKCTLTDMLAIGQFNVGWATG